MTTPTGNRWNDPDKMYDKDGKRLDRKDWPPEEERIANVRNVDVSKFRGKGHSKMVLGPATEQHAPSPDVDEDKAFIAAEIAEGKDLATAVAELRRGERGLDDPNPNPVEFPPDPTPNAELELETPPMAADGPEGRHVNPAAFETKTGSAMTGGDDSNELIEHVRALGKKAQNGDLPARAELEKIAITEYGREEPRMPITRRLSAYGIKKPGG